MSSDNEASARLAAAFRAEIARLDGPNSIFLQALDHEGTRQTLDELSEYDAFKDGFLLLPALQNMYVTSSGPSLIVVVLFSPPFSCHFSLATLPGHEDVAGLTALLDPSTLPGRVARINLLTRGSNALFLAMSPRPKPKELKDQDAIEPFTPPEANTTVVV